MSKSKEEKLVQNLREMVPMRFRLTHPKATHKKTTFINRLTSSMHLHADSAPEEPPFTLKFLEKLSDEHLLIGNEYQLNLLDLSGIQEDFVATSSGWSIAEDEPITQLFVMPKIRSFFVVCSGTLLFYSFRTEAVEDPPKLEQRIAFGEEVIAVYLVRKTTLLVFLPSRVEAFQITVSFGNTNLHRRCSRPYNNPKNFELIAVPEHQGHAFSIFFKEQPKPTAKVTCIFSMRVECSNECQLTVGGLHMFCEVPERYVSTVQIFYYGGEVFILQVGLQLYAVKHNYFLDNISTNTSKMRSFIKYLSNSHFFLFHKERFDYYHYELDERTKPEKFIVDCIDSIPLVCPKGAAFFDVKEMGQRLVFILQQSKSNQVLFWLGVSDPIVRERKIDSIYPVSQEQVEAIDQKSLQEKIELAQKIGYSSSEAYLEMWLRSAQNSIKDYEILIATEDYDMIADQIANKFKKSSLLWSEVHNVILRSLEMLREKIAAPHCSFQALKQFASCHFLLCKLEMFRKLKGAQADLMVSIQDYYYLASIELKKQLMELIGEFCLEGKDTIRAIRALFGQFAVIYRLLYHELLPKIGVAFKKQLLPLLVALPELLPIAPTEADIGNMQAGPWLQVDLQQSPDYLVLDNYATFENKKVLEQFPLSKFFKVYEWHTHGVLADSPQSIARKLSANSPTHIFILLYEVLYRQRQKIGEQQVKKLIDHIEATYSLLPTHLRGRFWFYCALYDIFLDYHKSQQKEFLGVFEFFSLGEEQLFLIYFRKERAKKGIFILKEVKPVYQRTVAEGGALFLANMFHFFKQGESSWADLKIILNKFNNEKQDFHRSNYRIFEVIVRAIMEKVHVGTGMPQEAGLGEVLSYIENIPFPLDDHSLLQDLVSIQQILQQEQLLKKIKINMNLRQILQRGEEVIFKMVEHQVQRHGVKDLKTAHELKLYAYKILSEIQYRKSNIYLDQHRNFALKSFLILLMEHESLISLCQPLLHEEYLCNQFAIDQKFVQNIVIFLYRKRLHKNPIYFENSAYIQQLSDLLAPNNQKRRFLQLSEQYAEMFTFEGGYKLKYPFFKTYYPRVEEVDRVVALLSKNEAQKVNVQQVFDLVLELKQLGQQVENIQQTQRNQFGNHAGDEKISIMKHQLYTIFFLKYVDQRLIPKALTIAADILAIPTRYAVYNIIFPIFLLQIILPQLLVRTQQPFVRLISYYFHNQKPLLQIATQLLDNRNVFSNDSLDVFIEQKRALKHQTPIFNPNNSIFSQPLRNLLTKMGASEQAKTFNPVFEGMWTHLQLHKEQFGKDKVYSVVFRLLLHNPYILAEYLYRKRSGINVCSLRALLSYISLHPLFDLQRVLELGQRIFSIILTKLTTDCLLEDVLQKYAGGEIYRAQLPYTDEYLHDQIKVTTEDIIGNSILSFRNKRQVHRQQSLQLPDEAKLQLILTLKNNPTAPQTLISYPYVDQDSSYMKPEFALQMKNKERKELIVTFHEVTERSEQCEHINYFVAPTYKNDKIHRRTSLQQFDQTLSKKLGHKKLHRAQSSAIDSKHQNDDLPQLNLPFDITEVNEDVQETHNNEEAIEGMMKKSQSLGNMVENSNTERDGKEEEEKTLRNLTSFIPMEKEKLEKKEKDEDPMRKAIRLFLEGVNEYFDPELLPSLPALNQRINFFEIIVTEIYRNTDTPLLRRIELIWELKILLLDEQAIDPSVQAVSLRLGSSQLVHSLLTPIEDIFSQAMFTEQFQQGTLMQLVKQNISEFVAHQQDMSKIAGVVGEVFESQKAQEEVLMLFLVKLCRAYAYEQDERIKNHLKDEIIFIQQSISPQEIANSIENYNRSRNVELRNTAKILQFFRDYTHHHHRRISLTDL